MKVKPLMNKVLIKPLIEEKSKIITVVSETEEIPNKGTIEAKGPDTTEHIKVGDKVIFGKYSGTRIDEKDDRILMSETDLLAVFD